MEHLAEWTVSPEKIYKKDYYTSGIYKKPKIYYNITHTYFEFDVKFEL